MLTPRKMTAVLVGVLVLILAGSMFMSAKAAPASYRPKVPVQRIGLACEHDEYLIWGARYCVTIRARKDRFGQWEFQPAAVIAGYNAQGRRSMRFLTAVRLNGHTTTGIKQGKRLVVRGPWQVGMGQAANAKAVFVWRWPNERKSAAKLYSHA